MSDDQEHNLHRLARGAAWGSLALLGFVCWWLYQGVGFWHDEMSFNSAYGVRKSPRVPLPAGTVPRDGAGYDALATAASTVPGSQLYADQCLVCHGTRGDGDTPVGREYNPRPPDLRTALASATDQELFTAISDGMVTPEINTQPPVGARWHAFHLYLDAGERHALVLYLRREFSPVPTP